jgi:CubicO group peptidase (beta-lactamase class C family)
MSFPRRRSPLIASLLVLFGGLATFAAPASAETAVAPVEIAAVLQPFVDQQVLAGAVTLVADRERILSHGAVGFADIAAQKAMRPDSLFWIASMSKPLTATALMMLVDEGKVGIEDPVAKYLPEFAGQMQEVKNGDQISLTRPATPVTVRHVLNHTSGMPFLSPVEKGKIDCMPLHEAVAGYAKLALKFAPGSAYQYSNCGTNTAGRIIEVVGGMPYEEFMRTRLFAPLGMDDTTCWPSAGQLARLATSYRPTADKSALEPVQINYLSYPLDDAKRGPCPGGGYFSTAKDLAAFGRMILNGGELDGRRYLSAAALRQMTSKQTGALEANYGFCWATTPDGSAFGHGGAYSTDLWIDTTQQLVTVFLVQHNGYAGKDGGKILPAFKQAAKSTFGKPRPQ